MKNIYGKTIKPKYEVALKQHVKGSVDDDYESIEFHSANNYWESVRMAKKYSFGIGSENKRFAETDKLDAGLVISMISFIMLRGNITRLLVNINRHCNIMMMCWGKSHGK